MTEKQAIQAIAETQPAFTPVRRPLVQRKCACGGTPGLDGECAACRAKRLTRKRQSTAQAEHSVVPPIVADVLASPGHPLDSAARSVMEPRFGHDFGHVRVHTDTKAAQSAEAVNARAYTVGHNVVFGAGLYRPETTEGKRLLAHELTHVIQQKGESPQSSALTLETNHTLEKEADSLAAQAAEGKAVFVQHSTSGLQMLQRDLATPAPAVAPSAQPDLSEEQIRQAIAFNRTRYDEANTRLIQRILGGPETGIWTEDNIIAIANTQEQFGLHKDGMVGTDTFRFIVNEEQLEGLSTATENCLTRFGAFITRAAAVRRVSPNQVLLSASFRTEAQFSDRCNCSRFEYRQFIRGHFRHTRAGVLIRDLALDFTALPAGSLTPTFNEDGDTTDATAVNYGHRADPPETNPENRYVNNRGTNDQANGCRYRSDDTPGFDNPAAPIQNCLPGDVLDAEIHFRGEIQRNGTPIVSREWSAIRGNFVAP